MEGVPKFKLMDCENWAFFEIFQKLHYLVKGGPNAFVRDGWVPKDGCFVVPRLWPWL